MNNIHLHIIGSKCFSDLLKELDFNYSISTDKDLKYNDKGFLVKIVFVEALQLLEIKKLFLENIPTIFLLNNKDFLKKNKLTLLDFHISLSVPIEILSFKVFNIL